MSRFYVPKECVAGNLITISGREAHHILDVMRLEKDDPVEVFDGTGNEYSGFIKEATGRSLVVEITRTRKAASGKNLSITLIQAVPKKDKMDYIVEKATELGVDSIIPVITDRTIVKWDGSKRKSVSERWQKIALEASKQCGRLDIPKVEVVKDYSEAIKGSAEFELSLVAALSDKAVKIRDAVSGCGKKKICIAIGPEGDFTDKEIGMALEKGYKLVSLGNRVLKSDTAGLFVLSILGYELEK